jgi:hypothetical protein
MNGYLQGIEENHVSLQSLSVQIQILETTTSTLEEQKEDLEL